VGWLILSQENAKSPRDAFYAKKIISDRSCFVTRSTYKRVKNTYLFAGTSILSCYKADMRSIHLQVIMTLLDVQQVGLS
jgi:hypothetical protein